MHPSRYRVARDTRVRRLAAVLRLLARSARARRGAVRPVHARDD